MTLTRRRFIALSASAVGLGTAPLVAGAESQVWRGRAMGAEVVVTLRGGDPGALWRLGRRIAARLDRLEQALSLYRASELVRLNETGVLAHPSGDLAAMLDLAGQLHATTVGVFDPSVQALWRARAEGRRSAAPFGWSKIERRGPEVRLPRGMVLTFNGVAQGYAADQLAQLVRDAGFDDVIVDAGEIAAIGQGGPVDILGDRGCILRQVVLRDECLATSSPGATRIGPDHAPHILHPEGRWSRWRTVSVAAPQAALADGLSTAFCLMTRDEIARSLHAWPEARLVLAAQAKFPTR